MIQKIGIRLGVNIDHIATIRQARKVDYPSLLEAAKICEKSGADGITAHLREDRRHIQKSDIIALSKNLKTKLNLEMAATDEMVEVARKIHPEDCCIVPERREELTTEGGLDVVGNLPRLRTVCQKLSAAGINVSFFVAAEKSQIDAAKSCGAPMIEIHTGDYANAKNASDRAAEFLKIQQMANYAKTLGLTVNAGHGLTLENVAAVAKLPEITELNIGHSIVARAIFIGIAPAVAEMKKLLVRARK